MNTSFDADPQQLSLEPVLQGKRREFLLAAAIAGMALSATPIVAQQMIVTSPDGLDTGSEEIPGPSGSRIPIYFAAPGKGGRHPVVLVIPEIWGAHEHIKDVARRLAREGYFAVVGEPYFRIADLTRLTDIKDVIAGANQLSDVQCHADLDATVEWLGKHPKADAGRMGITGFCRGGRTTWMYSAHNDRIRAGVAWYGGLNAMPPAMPQTPADVASKLKAPVLGLYGGADQGIPQAAVEKLNAALAAAGRDQQCLIHVYPGMPHAFHADYRPSYRKETAEDAWKRMLAWFRKNGVRSA